MQLESMIDKTGRLVAVLAIGLLTACGDELPRPLRLDTRSLPPVNAFALYEFQLLASGGAQPYTWEVSGLPAGLVLDEDSGLIASDPLDPLVDPVDTEVEVSVVDANGEVAGLILPLEVITAAQVVGGDLHTCALDTRGAAWCWGPNSYGRLGTGDSDQSRVPRPVAGGHEFSTLAAGLEHTCGIDTAGAAWCWGSYLDGRLGSDVDEMQPSPVKVAGTRTYTSITAGGSHTCAIDSAGAAWCWGGNVWGQLGDQSYTARPFPVAVVGGLVFRQLTAGRYHTCGLDEGDLAWCWGRNTDGESGHDLSLDSNEPVAVMNAGAFVAIGAGEHHTCGIGVGSGGRAWCWGDNTYYQLGDDVLAATHIPNRVGDETYAMFSVGAWHACGIENTGPAMCWGHNQSAQLGDGTTTNSYDAVVTLGVPQLAQIASGGYHTCGITETGEVWCWGSNVYGQLGVGNIISPGAPSRVRPGLVVGP